MQQEEIIKVVQEAKDGNHSIEIVLNNSTSPKFIAQVDKSIGKILYLKPVNYSKKNDNFKEAVVISLIHSIRISAKE